MRKLMWFVLGFTAACALCVYLPMQNLFGPGIFAGMIGIGMLLGARKIRSFRLPAAIFLGIAAGFAMFQIYGSTYLSDAKELDGQTERMTIIVRDYSYETVYGTAFDGSVKVGEKMYPVRVYLDEKVFLEPGNRVRGDFEFNQTAEGGIDDVLYHRGEGIFLLASQKSHVVIERFWSTPWRDLPTVWRRELKSIIDSVFPDDAAGFAKALMLGDRTDIDYETNTAFKISGISHIIAVSGLHVSILFGAVDLLSAKRRFLTALLGVPAVLIFAAVVGFTPSVTRAAIMQVLMMLALLLQREYDPPTALSFSGLAMLIWNPYVITSVSFQLSFACMAGIFTFSGPIRNWLKDEKRLGWLKGSMINGIISTISVSLGAGVFTTPLVALYFGTVSLVSLVTNLLTLWVITFIFYGILLACVFGSAVAAVVAWPIRYVLEASKWVASFPLAAVYVRNEYIAAWLIFVYVLLGIYLFLKKKPAVAFGSLALTSLCLALTLSWTEPLMDDYRMTMLDVGQGQAILLQSDGKTFLVDCGGDDDEYTADIVAETLLSQGISRLDGVMLTHFDRDHAGALPYLMTRVEVDTVYLPFAYDEDGVTDVLMKQLPDGIVTVKEDLSLRFEGTSISIFAPISYNSGNESSMSVLFQKENCDILITGDMGESGERLLTKYHDLPQVDVLVAGHHGSKHSTTEVLLEEVQPDYAFISVGKNNRYGHPADAVLQRLLEYGCIIYATDEYGTIIYRG